MCRAEPKVSLSVLGARVFDDNGPFTPRGRAWRRKSVNLQLVVEVNFCRALAIHIRHTLKTLSGVRRRARHAQGGRATTRRRGLSLDISERQRHCPCLLTLPQGSRDHVQHCNTHSSLPCPTICRRSIQVLSWPHSVPQRRRNLRCWRVTATRSMSRHQVVLQGVIVAGGSVPFSRSLTPLPEGRGRSPASGLMSCFRAPSIIAGPAL